MRFEEFHPKMEEMVATIASECGARGRRYGADHEDFRQEFMVWLLTNQEFVGLLMDTNSTEAMAYVGRTLRTEGKSLLREMGAPESAGHNPWHGRRAVSNAAARARQSQTYTSGGPE